MVVIKLHVVHTNISTSADEFNMADFKLGIATIYRMEPGIKAIKLRITCSSQNHSALYTDNVHVCMCKE